MFGFDRTVFLLVSFTFSNFSHFVKLRKKIEGSQIAAELAE